MNGKIGKLCGAVPPHSAATKTVQTEHDVFIVESPASVGAKAAAVSRGVIGTQSAGACTVALFGQGPVCADDEVSARKDAVAEPVIESEDLVVSKTRIERRLGDDIGRWVEGISAAGDT